MIDVMKSGRMTYVSAYEKMREERNECHNEIENSQKMKRKKMRRRTMMMIFSFCVSSHQLRCNVDVYKKQK